MTQNLSTIACLANVNPENHYKHDIRFELTRYEYRENYSECLAVGYLKKSLEVASIQQLALPMGIEAINYLTNSLEIVKKQPLALISTFGGMDECNTFFTFTEKGKVEQIICDRPCPFKAECTARNVTQTEIGFECRYTGQTFEQCPNCKAYFESNRMHVATDLSGKLVAVCEECLEHECELCECCGEYYEKSEKSIFEVENYGTVCKDCIEKDELFAQCEYCEKWFKKSDTLPINDNEFRACTTCAHEHCHRCDNCGDYSDSEHTILDSNFPPFCLCHACYDAGGYEICQGCGHIINIENDNGVFRSWGYYCEYCKPCASDIREYSYKPAPVFQKTEKDLERGNLYMGIELEFSHYDERDMIDSLEYAKEYLNNGEAEDEYYFKEDASLEEGYEIVSHPRTLNSWLEEKEKFRKFFLDAEGNIREGRDGLHIHISKTGMSEIHKIRFSTFVACYKEQIKIIARRETDYATYRDKPENGLETKALLGNYDRYEAVNWTNRSTVELRIFRNTLEVRTLFACIEFAHALYQFTKSHCSLQEILKGEAWTSFIKFIKTDERYQDLQNYLREYYENPENALADADYAKVLRPKTKHDLSLVRYCCLHP